MSVKAITVAQLAAEAGITEAAVRSLIKRRRIVAEKIGGTWLIGAASAQRFLATYKPYRREK
jgi:hypothetical protein